MGEEERAGLSSSNDRTGANMKVEVEKVEEPFTEVVAFVDAKRGPKLKPAESETPKGIREWIGGAQGVAIAGSDVTLTTNIGTTGTTSGCSILAYDGKQLVWRDDLDRTVTKPYFTHIWGTADGQLAARTNSGAESLLSAPAQADETEPAEQESTNLPFMLAIGALGAAAFVGAKMKKNSKRAIEQVQV